MIFKIQEGQSVEDYIRMMLNKRVNSTCMNFSAAAAPAQGKIDIGAMDKHIYRITVLNRGTATLLFYTQTTSQAVSISIPVSIPFIFDGFPLWARKDVIEWSTNGAGTVAFGVILESLE